MIYFGMPLRNILDSHTELIRDKRTRYQLVLVARDVHMWVYRNNIETRAFNENIFFLGILET